MAITCPTVPISLEGTQICRGKAVHMKFQQRHSKYIKAVRAEPGTAGLQPHFLPLFWETFDNHGKSSYWLGRQLQHAPGIRDRLLREIHSIGDGPREEAITRGFADDRDHEGEHASQVLQYAQAYASTATGEQQPPIKHSAPFSINAASDTRKRYVFSTHMSCFVWH